VTTAVSRADVDLQEASVGPGDRNAALASGHYSHGTMAAEILQLDVSDRAQFSGEPKT
jgi:hypothetical protein